jgi:hypothetical protein
MRRSRRPPGTETNRLRAQDGSVSMTVQTHSDLVNRERSGDFNGCSEVRVKPLRISVYNLRQWELSLAIFVLG